jgi:hypothetical protein
MAGFCYVCKEKANFPFESSVMEGIGCNREYQRRHQQKNFWLRLLVQVCVFLDWTKRNLT